MTALDPLRAREIRRWLEGWAKELESLDKTPGAGDVVHALTLDVAVSMGLELLDSFIPEGYALVKKPELLDKGVPER